MFTEIRRKDRILENEPAVRLLEGGEYGFLAMAGSVTAYRSVMCWITTGISIFIVRRKDINWNV